jgi:hypothetical protein
MPLKIRTGGAWHDVPTGGARIRSGGQWIGASAVKIRDQGVWKDSGYVGFPGVPTGFYVSSWTFSQVTVNWSPPAAGGAPVHHYEVVMTDSAGNWMSAPTTTGLSYSFGVAEDYRVRFYVRSVSAAGLVSGWAGSIGAQIGHTEINHQQANTGTRAWQSGAVAINLYNGGFGGPQVPDSVYVDHFYVNLSQAGLCQGENWAYLSPGTGTVRNIFFITQSQIRRDIGRITLGNPSHGQLNIAGNGGTAPNNGWGLYAEGAGYAAGPATSACRVVGDLEVFGTETYTYYTTVIDRARVENSYW